MSEPVLADPTRNKRIVFHHKSAKSGPVLITLAGMHGNETYGVAALRKIGELLSQSGGVTKGEWIGLIANTGAIREGVRFVNEDMNRIWFPSIVDKIRRAPDSDLGSVERQEIKEILQVIDPYLLQNDQPVIFVDLHSFSAPGGLFLITPRNPKNIELGSGLETPLIFGVDDVLQGTAIRYISQLGHISYAFEGGEHHSPDTFTNMVAFMLLLSKKAGVIDSSYVREFDGFHHRLARESENLPRRVELIYQHLIEPDDQFVMKPGYENFQPVQKGEWLADDKNGKIHASYDGYILMPLYQSQGEDGFFIVREA